jgi:hypothetical protein
LLDTPGAKLSVRVTPQDCLAIEGPVSPMRAKDASTAPNRDSEPTQLVEQQNLITTFLAARWPDACRAPSGNPSAMKRMPLTAGFRVVAAALTRALDVVIMTTCPDMP